MVFEANFENDVLMAFNSFNNSAIIAFTDLTGKILEVNGLFCQISGYNREELIGKDHRLINSGYHEKSFFKAMWLSIQSGNIWTGEIKNRSKNGSFYWVHTVISPVMDQSGKIVKFMAVRFDITRQKNMEQHILTNVERLSLALGGPGRGIWDWNTEKEELIVSDYLMPLFGSSKFKKPVTLEDFIDASHPEDRSLLRESIEQALVHKSSFNINHRILWSDGSIRWINNQGDVVKYNNEASSRLVGLVQDITSAKLLEEAKMRLASLEKQIALGEMACGIIHEINNPLTIISGRLSMLKLQLNDDGQWNHKALLESISVIESAANRMAGITKDLGQSVKRPPL